MKHAHAFVPLVLALALSGPALAQADGSPQVGTYNLESSWSRIQARLTLGVDSSNPIGEFDSASTRLTSVSLLGDYYMSGPIGTRSGGLRATSGLLAGPRGTLWGGLAAGSGLNIERRASTTSFLLGDTDRTQTVPYLGIGYTGLSLRDGWGVSVDVGLMALRPRQLGQLGGVLNGSQSFDGMLRDMRLSPILQLGISYSF